MCHGVCSRAEESVILIPVSMRSMRMVAGAAAFLGLVEWTQRGLSWQFALCLASLEGRGATADGMEQAQAASLAVGMAARACRAAPTHGKDRVLVLQRAPHGGVRLCGMPSRAPPSLMGVRGVHRRCRGVVLHPPMLSQRMGAARMCGIGPWTASR